ncbi:MAG: efflux RND transporter periplasmic adaptor subunit [Myxococcales bacterium]|nr:efflux RND transporter periplasmic adaptor subunit [Myxococcales bacterium]
MITPLKKHPGQHGGFIAIMLLVATTVVVWTARPTRETPPPPPRAAPLPGAVADVAQPRASLIEQPKTAPPIVDERGPVIAKGTTYFDESRTSHVGVPVNGWLKKTRASSLGRTVRAGEVLGTVYSAEVLFTTASVVSQVRDYRGQEALDADRWRLLRWGMSQPTLTRIEKTFKPQASLPLVARTGGTVVAEAGAPAQAVERFALELFTITDPAYVWVFVDVPDAVAARLTAGAPAKLAIEGVASPVTAKVAYVYRSSEAGMRKVRFELHQPRSIIPRDAAVTAEISLDATRPGR